eukprot:465807-Prymnesium_polylepis.1
MAAFSAISVLTGLIHPTAGRASVAGFDIESQMHKIYYAMGVCPQYAGRAPNPRWPGCNSAHSGEAAAPHSAR